MGFQPMLAALEVKSTLKPTHTSHVLGVCLGALGVSAVAFTLIALQR